MYPRQKLYVYLYICFLLLSLVSCTSYTKKLDPELKSDPKMAYLFGNFFIDTNKAAIILGMEIMEIQPPHLLHTEVLPNIYTIKFDRDNPFTLFAMKPGKYRIRALLTSSYFNETTSKKLLKNKYLSQPFTVNAGTAYYFGDVFGYAKKETIYNVKTTYWWGIKNIVNDYAAAKATLTQDYKHFAQQPTEVIQFLQDYTNSK